MSFRAQRGISGCAYPCLRVLVPATILVVCWRLFRVLPVRARLLRYAVLRRLRFFSERSQSRALPYDPLELATGPTVIPETPEKRALLLNLIERARQNGAMHTPATAPFDIKVSRNSLGKDAHNQGYGELEEVWVNGSTWRWSARLGDYSQFRISTTARPTMRSPAAIFRFACRWSATPYSGRSAATSKRPYFVWQRPSGKDPMWPVS